MHTFSILIPTFNRPNLLNNLLTYFNNSTIKFNIIIADSSSPENKTLNENVIKNHNGSNNISYMSNFSKDVTLIEKISISLESISTKYCVICADDDFISPQSIDKMTSFLDDNNSYFAAHGRYLGFWEYKYKNKRRICWNNKYNVVSVDQKSPIDRFVFHFLNYGISGIGLPTFYSVHRTRFLKLIFNEVVQYTDDMRFAEILLTLLTVIYGKIKCFDDLYGFRQTNDFQSSGYQLAGIKSYLRDNSFQEKYADFKTCLLKHFTKLYNYEERMLEQKINYSTYMYLSNAHFLSNNKNKVKKLLKITNLPLLRMRIRFIFNSKHIPRYLFFIRLDFLKVFFQYRRNNKYININSNELYLKFGKELIKINEILLHENP